MSEIKSPEAVYVPRISSPLAATIAKVPSESVPSGEAVCLVYILANPRCLSVPFTSPVVVQGPSQGPVKVNLPSIAPPTDRGTVLFG